MDTNVIIMNYEPLTELLCIRNLKPGSDLFNISEVICCQNNKTVNTYPALKDILGLEGTQMVSGSKMTKRSMEDCYMPELSKNTTTWKHLQSRKTAKPLTDALHTESAWNLLKLFLL